MEKYKITKINLYPGNIEVIGENDELLNSITSRNFAVGGDDIDCYYDDAQLFDDNSDPILTEEEVAELEEKAYKEAIKDFTEELLDDGFIIDEDTDYNSAFQYNIFCKAVRWHFNLPHKS